MSNAFQAGEQVQLISGGPPMTIDSWDGEMNAFICVWFEGTKANSRHFGAATLKKYVEPSNAPIPPTAWRMG